MWESHSVLTERLNTLCPAEPRMEKETLVYTFVWFCREHLFCFLCYLVSNAAEKSNSLSLLNRKKKKSCVNVSAWKFFCSVVVFLTVSSLTSKFEVLNWDRNLSACFFSSYFCANHLTSLTTLYAPDRSTIISRTASLHGVTNQVCTDDAIS